MSFINSEQNQSQGTTGTVTCNMPQNMRVAIDADGTTYRPLNPNYNGNNNNNGSGNNNNGNNSNVFDVPSFQVVLDGGGAGGGINSEPMKKKRGRPRKYSMLGDGSLNTGYNNQQQNQNQNQAVYSSGFQSPTPPPPPQHAASEAAGPVSPTSGTVKKPRGRPPGSLNKKPSLAGRGFGFIPHIIIVKAGENILSKIMTLTQHGSRAVCVLSANGTISNVTLCQAATSGGTVTYEGPFEILSLSGSFLLSESSGQRSRTGGLSVSLAGPDGRVFGGGVAGLLTAGNSVQVVCGSFSAEERKESKSNQADGHAAARAPAAESPSSHGAYSESSGGNATASNQSTGPCNNNNTHGMLNVPWQ